MARPQSFDTNEVLYKALEVFWQRGFEAASLPELMRATGLSKSSLYGSFGSKRELFLAAFDKYRADRVEEMNRLLGAGSGRKAVESFFRKIVADVSLGGFRNGCMSTNQAVELAPEDTDIQRRVLSDFQTIEHALCLAIMRGKSDGSITADFNAEDIAGILVSGFPGIQVLVRSGMASKRLDKLVDSLLCCLVKPAPNEASCTKPN